MMLSMAASLMNFDLLFLCHMFCYWLPTDARPDDAQILRICQWDSAHVSQGVAFGQLYSHHTITLTALLFII